jgi:hypothetical protein
MKTMTKSKAYKQVITDVDFAKEQVELFADRIQEIGHIHVGNTLTLTSDSSDKQYVFAIGVLNSQIASCKELGIEDTNYVETKELVINLRVVTKELKDWNTYLRELEKYKTEVYKLLSDDEKFELLDYPKK